MSTTTKKQRTAAIYCRISQDRTGEHLGVDRQEAICRKLARERGWTVAAVFTDNDLSAFSGKRRPDYEQMLHDVEVGVVDALIAVDQDRLVRRVGEVDRLIKLCEKNDTLVLLASGEIDTSNADGILKAHLLGVVGENESRKKSERVKRQRDQAAKQGTYAGGRRAYGYDRDGITVLADEAKIVREVVRRYLAGQSLRSICFDLNERKVATYSGGPWRITSLRSIITNPRYAGLRVHRGEVVGDATWKPIISRAQHEQLRAKLGDPRRKTERGRPAVHLLAGLLRCGHCGNGLTITKRKRDGRLRYACKKTPHGGCSGIAVVAEPVEQLVTDAVLYRLDSKAVAKAMNNRTRKHTDDDVVADLAAFEEQLDALAADFGNGDISRREWLAARAPLERRRDAARRAVESTGDGQVLAPFAGARQPGNVWARLSLDQRRAVLATLIDRIVIAPAQYAGAPFNPDRVDLEWRA